MTSKTTEPKTDLNKLKTDQLRMIDWYLEQAQEDETFKKFLEIMVKRIQAGLNGADSV